MNIFIINYGGACAARTRKQIEEINNYKPDLVGFLISTFASQAQRYLSQAPAR